MDYLIPCIQPWHGLGVERWKSTRRLWYEHHGIHPAGMTSMVYIVPFDMKCSSRPHSYPRLSLYQSAQKITDYLILSRARWKMSDIKSKGGATIEEGDTVSTPVGCHDIHSVVYQILTALQYRGGKHEGKVSINKSTRPLVICWLVGYQVEQIVTDDKEAQNLGAKGTNHAPAVVFTDQNNKKVAHKPGTVTDLDKESWLSVYHCTVICSCDQPTLNINQLFSFFGSHWNYLLIILHLVDLPIDLYTKLFPIWQ